MTQTKLRQDYTLDAQTISQVIANLSLIYVPNGDEHSIQLQIIAEEFADALHEQNHSFDRDEFIESVVQQSQQ